MELTVLHDGDQAALVLQHAHVARRIAVDQQQVGEVALADQAELVAQAHDLPAVGGGGADCLHRREAEQVDERSEEHTSELQSLMRISYAVFCLKKTTILPHIN